MGIIERRERERQATRQGILDAARHIAQQEGWNAVTIRKIADRLEYASPIIYQHFKNKEAALEAILHDGFVGLVNAITRDLAQESDPTERLMRLGRAYVRFAQQQPEVYEIMNGMGGVALDPAVRQREAAEVVRLVEQVFGEWATAQGLLFPNPGERTEALWGLAHGLVSIALLERTDARFDAVQRLLEDTVLDLLSAWSGKARV